MEISWLQEFQRVSDLTFWLLSAGSLLSQATTTLSEVRDHLLLTMDSYQLGREEASNTTLKSLALKSGVVLFGTQADLVWNVYYIAYLSLCDPWQIM